MTVLNFTDIAVHVCRQYRERLRSSDKKGLFVSIQEEAYSLYGERFGYKDVHTFKSDLTKLVNKLRKNRMPDLSDEEIAISNSLNKRTSKPTIGGSSCFKSIFYQITQVGLNADSYL